MLEHEYEIEKYWKYWEKELYDVETSVAGSNEWISLSQGVNSKLDEREGASTKIKKHIF